MLWLQFVPPAVTVPGFMDMELFPGSKVCLYIPPVPQIHAPTQTFL